MEPKYTHISRADIRAEMKAFEAKVFMGFAIPWAAAVVSLAVLIVCRH